ARAPGRVARALLAARDDGRARGRAVRDAPARGRARAVLVGRGQGPRALGARAVPARGATGGAGLRAGEDPLRLLRPRPAGARARPGRERSGRRGGGPMSARVSVVIPALDDRELLARNLPPLLDELTRRAAGDELIVVDDTGEDRLAAW